MATKELATKDWGPLWKTLLSLFPRGTGEHRYLLINQAAFGANSALMKRLEKFPRAALLHQSVDACTDGATPFLVLWEGWSTDAQQLRTIQTLCEQGCYACAVSALDSSLNIDQLAAALTARCTVRLPEGIDMLLRFFDTRVMDALIDVLKPDQIELLVSCTTRWMYAGREGPLDPVSLSDREGRDTFVTPIELTQKQQNALIDAGEPDLVIGLLVDANIEPLIKMPVPRRYRAISQLIAKARQWGLSETPDFAAYCSLALSIGTGFAEQAPWSELLPEVKAKRLTFSQALATAESQTQ
jgi:Domain of unknown function (DUF4123)